MDFGDIPADPATAYPVGVGTVEVTLNDGSTHNFANVRYEANRMENGFLVMETNHRWEPRVYHVPNVISWEIVY
jgi:hypothetical protein